MPASKNPGTYTDCHQILETALARNGIKVQFATSGKAVHFRMRLNIYRKLLHTIQAQDKPVGYVTSTPYDHFTFRQDGAFVNIEPRGIGDISISDLSGNDVPVPEFDTNPELLAPEDDDDLLSEVDAIMQDIRKTGGLNID